MKKKITALLILGVLLFLAILLATYSAHIDITGTKIGEIIFTGQNGDSGTMSIIVPLFPANISFDAENLKCRINPHVIKSPFTTGYE